jgi:hypothetical protein
MKTFKINMIEKHYGTFEIKAEDIETAKELLIDGVDAELEPLIPEIKTVISNYEDDVVTEFYDNEWNEI